MFHNNQNDSDGNPAGGTVVSTGMTVVWQNGPVQGNKPNGAQCEQLIAACIFRLEFYQESKFCCVENKMAISYLRNALESLEERTRDREKRGVEGENKV